MFDGTIEGGWGYVIAVYGFTWFCLVAYTTSLVVRLHKDTDA
jgi:hypothetical protein